MGVLASLVSAVFSSAKDIVSKKVAAKVGGGTSALASFLFAIPYYVVLIAIFCFLGIEDFQLTGTFWVLVLFRAMADTIAETLKMYAFSYGDISIVTSIFALWPLFLLIMSPLITGDALTWNAVLALIFTSIGGIMLARSGKVTNRKENRRAMGLALIAAVFFALNHSLDRLAVQNGSPLLSGFVMTALSCILLVPFAQRNSQLKNELRANISAFNLRGAFEVGFMLSKLYALQFLQAPYVASLQRLSVLLSIGAGKIFFKEENFVQRLTAGCFILLGVLFALLGGQ